MDKIHLQLLFASRPAEVDAIVMKAGKQPKEQYDGIEEWKQNYVTMVYHK